jgi:DNA-binding NarL/FixJ family response regulator
MTGLSLQAPVGASVNPPRDAGWKRGDTNDVSRVRFEGCEPSKPLTAAERHVASLATAGMKNAAIAKHRCTSELTVANQMASILRKLRLRSRCELAAAPSGYDGEQRVRLEWADGHATRGGRADANNRRDLLNDLIEGRLHPIELSETTPFRRFVVFERSAEHLLQRALNAREREVVRRIAAKQMQKEIAYDLSLSASAVSACLKAALGKLGLQSRADLIMLVATFGALENGSTQR